MKKLPELKGRIKRIQESLEALKAALYETDKAKGTALTAQPKMPLKREAAIKLEKLVVYLKAMSTKDPDAYGKDFAVVTQIIKRLNAKRRSKGLQIEVELEDDKKTTEEPQPTVGD